MSLFDGWRYWPRRLLGVTLLRVALLGVTLLRVALLWVTLLGRLLVSARSLLGVALLWVTLSSAGAERRIVLRGRSLRGGRCATNPYRPAINRSFLTKDKESN